MEYIAHIAIIATLYAGLALSLNLLVGYTGILSIAHAGFYGIGAYTTAILMKGHGFSFLAGSLCGVGVTMLISLVVGSVLSRVSGDYYALGSFGFNMIVFSILMNWDSLTSGPLGILAIPRPTLFGFTFFSNWHFFFLTLSLVLCCALLSYGITRSHFGRVLRAIRDDSAVLAAFSYNVAPYKFIIFCVAAALASVCGSLYATYISYIDPTSFTLNESIFILTIIILGGLASLRGSIVGAFVLVLLPEALRFVGLPAEIAAQLRVVLYGIAIVALMYWRPLGLFGKYTP